jgi:hypothetical protein
MSIHHGVPSVGLPAATLEFLPGPTGARGVSGRFSGCVCLCCSAFLRCRLQVLNEQIDGDPHQDQPSKNQAHALASREHSRQQKPDHRSGPDDNPDHAVPWALDFLHNRIQNLSAVFFIPVLMNKRKVSHNSAAVFRKSFEGSLTSDNAEPSNTRSRVSLAALGKRSQNPATGI